MVKEKIIGFEEVTFHKLITSKDDMKIRSHKFKLMQEREKLNNKIYWLKNDSKNMLTQITKCEKRERELLGFKEIPQEKVQK